MRRRSGRRETRAKIRTRHLLHGSVNVHLCAGRSEVRCVGVGNGVQRELLSRKEGRWEGTFDSRLLRARIHRHALILLVFLLDVNAVKWRLYMSRIGGGGREGERRGTERLHRIHLRRQALHWGV